MIFTTLPDGVSGWLNLYSPELSKAPTLRLNCPMYSDRGATGREGRRPKDPTITASLEWEAELTLADVAALRAALLAYQNEPVAVPCWPLAVTGAAYSYGTTPQGGYMIAWRESGTYAFFTGAVSSPASWDWIAPLLCGYFDSTPKAVARTDEAVRYAFAFTDDAPAAWSLGPFPAAPNASGPALGGFTPPGFPFDLNWAQQVESGAAGIVVTREDLSAGRQRLSTFFPNVAERGLRGSVTLSDPWPLCAWWNAQGGPAQSQWVSTYLSVGQMAQNANTADTVITFSSAPACVAGNTVAFHVIGATDQIFFRLVQSVSGNQITLTAGLPYGVAARTTAVCLAMLARHASETLTIAYAGPGNVTAALDWVEVAAEYTPAAGETRGTTLGRKNGRPWLIEISSEQPVSEVLYRVTDWSTGVVLGDGRSFAFRALAVGSRTRSIDLSEQSLDVVIPWESGSPLQHFRPGQAYRRLYLRLYYVPIDSAGTVGSAVQDWYGEITNCQNVANKLLLKVGGPTAVMQKQVPCDEFGVSCNAHFGDSRCGVSRAAWTVTASVVSSSGATLVIGSATRAGGSMAPLQASGAMALGTLQWVSGGVTRLVGIYGSTYSGGNYTLTLRESVSIAGATSVTIVPGCDLQWLGGCARYSGKFRGFPNIPARAPQFAIPQAATSSGKKG